MAAHTHFDSADESKKASLVKSEEKKDKKAKEKKDKKDKKYKKKDTKDMKDTKEKKEKKRSAEYLSTDEPSSKKRKSGSKDKGKDKSKSKDSKKTKSPESSESSEPKTEAAPVVSGWNNWADADLGSEARKNKFLRLMGVRNVGNTLPPTAAASSSSPFESAITKQGASRINQDLQKNFDIAMSKHVQAPYGGGAGKRGGLGF
ncbi:hypothetical protein LPJ66_007931 [Kickxella alabastrina]|uniref:Uncharacterized protein n=1 Tax=Kickxella alabastrina TaxID=61397 RepID=A0ACC1I7H3_9FUNG|nr:hypothetical protein LPJ66_007931 [Kickxella alabastrina]